MNYDQERESGRLGCDGRVLTYHGRGTVVWELAVADLVAVGEYTSGNGPFVDDYFFVFVEVTGGYRQASFYAVDSADTMKQLGSILRADLAARLCNSTEWKTRIMWPERLRDHPLFDLRDAPEEGAGLARRLRRRLLGPPQTAVLSEAVMALSGGAA